MNLEKLRNNLYIFLHIIRIKVILGVGHQVDNDKSKSYPCIVETTRIFHNEEREERIRREREAREKKLKKHSNNLR